ncbi:hypothetical protein GOZ68_07510 [Vibrio parahaemolyticus]|nr:hypothetical protein [Vibrio parahaemolyticus]
MSHFISNAFQVPNAVIDDLMANLSPNALKCYLLIVRKTTGWGKTSDRISESQFMDKTGIKNVKTVRSALVELVELGLIHQDKKRGQITEYSLVLDSENQCQKLVVPKNGTSTKKRIEVVPKNGTSTSTKNWHPTKDTIKTTNTKEKNKQKSEASESSFERFWKSYPRKNNKQGALKSFKAAFKKQTLSENEFTDMLINDVTERIARNQFGFDRLHATTYLNNERWNDPHEENQPSITGTGHKPNSVEAYNERLLAKYGHTTAPVEREINPIDGDGLGEHQVSGGVFEPLDF